ncbi:MAG: glycosyltransferase [Ignavibacteriales bacterium]|nr:glycosyltransferase [Ignavibacteriales bacterium]
MIKYSIIIPTLNEEKLLPQLLQVLTENDLKIKYNFEIIISDGGSTDKTIEIAEKYADKIIKHDPKIPQNIAQGRNVGAHAASGEILIFYNGDILPDNMNLVFNTIDAKFANSSFLAMTCCVKVFEDEQKFVDLVFQTFYNYYFHLLNIIGLGMGRGECHIVKNNIFKEFNGYDENLAAGEDFDLYKRIRKKGKILFARNLVVFESPRRYRKLGHFRIFFTWLINSVYIIFAKKSKSTEWKEVR